jgi:two-component system sensor histidine kinase/response regulator
MADQSPPRSGPLVLYVDDERGNRVVFEQLLAKDFNIKVASDPNEALAILAASDVAVLVTDMRMPVMTGDELLRIVKEKWPQTIRMVVTAFDDVDPILRAINEGLVARYLIKPWVHEEMVQVLRWATEAWTFSRDSAELHRRLLETERLATLGSMAGMLVHDLRQPLMSMMMNIDHLSELVAAAPVLRAAVEGHVVDPAERQNVLELIEELEPMTNDFKTSADHLNTMITGLRDLGRPRKEGETPGPADPLPIVRHAMAVCKQLALSVHASIDYSGPSQLPRVRMSTTELTQVLINLIANSTQAVAARGSPNGHVSIVARQSQDTLEIQIKDDGVGIPPDVLKRVGTPFFTTRKEGTGLGLANVQRLVGTAGGRLQIESEVGVGTTVTIRLPIAA